MYMVEYRQTMKNARPKFKEPEVVVRSIEQIRTEKRIEAARLRREQARAWVARMEERHRAEMARIEQEITVIASPEPRERKMPVQEIIAGVAAVHRIPVDAIMSPRRDKQAVAARFEAIVAVRNEHPHLSLTQLGRIFKRDHTSLIHALRVMAKRAAQLAAGEAA